MAAEDREAPDEERDRPAIPDDPADWDIDITESEGPDLQAGDDLDTGAAGGQRKR